MMLADELRQAPEVVARQAATLAQPLAELAGRLRRRPPRVVVTCARGSSAHAATYAKHLIELYLGIPVAAAAPNIASATTADGHPDATAHDIGPPSVRGFRHRVPQNGCRGFEGAGRVS